MLRRPGGALVVVGTTTVRLRSYGSDVPGEDDDDFCAVGLRADGRIERGFGDNGRRLIEIGRPVPAGTVLDQDIVHSAALDSRGATTIAGTVDGDQHQALGIVRLTRRGRLDRTFAGDGRLTVRFARRVEGVENPSVAIDSSGRTWIAAVTYRGDQFRTRLFAFSRSGRRIASGAENARTRFERARVWDLTLDDERPVIAANVGWSGLGPPPSGYAVLMRLDRPRPSRLATGVAVPLSDQRRIRIASPSSR